MGTAGGALGFGGRDKEALSNDFPRESRGARCTDGRKEYLIRKRVCMWNVKSFPLTLSPGLSSRAGRKVKEGEGVGWKGGNLLSCRKGELGPEREGSRRPPGGMAEPRLRSFQLLGRPRAGP